MDTPGPTQPAGTQPDPDLPKAQPMVDATIRWSLYALALVVAGPLAGMLMDLSDAPNGSAGTILVSASPALGVVSLLLGCALAGGVGALAAWRCGIRPGMTCAGIVLTWMAGMSSGLTDAIAAAGHGPWTRLLIEGVLVAICLGLIGVALALAGQRHRPRLGEHIAPQSAQALASEPGLGLSARALVGVGVAVLAGGAAGWLLAVADLRGQVIAAAALACIAGALIVKLADLNAPALAAILAGAVLAIASPAYALASVAPQQALADAYAQRLPGLVLLTPLDWAAGVLLGAPIGLAWAASIVKRAEA